MIKDQELLKRIMGMPDSVTGKLVALRRDPTDEPLETGVWYSNFTRVKTEAETRGIPFFAMWTNGDLCGFCRRFAANVLDPAFIEKMKTSGGLWWLGGSMDDNEEDGRRGKGFTWCIGPEGKVNYFPFFAVVHSVNGNMEHGFFGSGHDYDQRKSAPDGVPHIMEKIADILSSPYLQYGDATKKPAAIPSEVKTNTVYHIRFNPDWDVDHIARFQNALKENGGHCICQKDKTPDTMCMCKSFLEQDKPGLCHCGAFERYQV